MSPRRNWDSPNPFPPRECALPPGPKGRGAHSPAAKGVGESQFRRLEKKFSTLPTLCRTTFTFVGFSLVIHGCHFKQFFKIKNPKNHTYFLSSSSSPIINRLAKSLIAYRSYLFLWCAVLLNLRVSRYVSLPNLIWTDQLSQLSSSSVSIFTTELVKMYE
jgi:hypothetical protein